MRRYETIYILRPSLNEEEINTVVDNTNGIITESDGKIIELDRWGMRKLAYPIKKESQGFYVYCDYSGAPEAVSEMERKFRIDDKVLRFMTVKTAESISDEEIAEAVNLASTKKIETEEVEEIGEVAEANDSKAKEEVKVETEVKAEDSAAEKE